MSNDNKNQPPPPKPQLAPAGATAAVPSPAEAQLLMLEALMTKLGAQQADALKEGMAMGLAMAARVKSEDDTKLREAKQKAWMKGPKCSECRQLATACNGKHRKMVVFPRSGKWGRWFQGVRIGGVRYLSNGPGHKVTVPANSNIEYIVQQWEKNEEELRHGREATHHSGSISGRAGGSGNFKQAQRGWR